ncbi:hypothetical protein NSK_000864 [Nannochloropsis salina CCMP1776]|uniref:Uncharacterized protein n=1 Tax=Nannochloropsis salina CCMP1776 TaxID=1027361 RepID=A0A4D9D7E8_9STRA|nr:hypothetical protein NSK_000864 [Nannochloropsis salina CCMP1776]|eukprot:TFJ87512.1 hypothetical protein NSK_000864 [Nannochloropsis salina CCMP1776]
MDVSTKTNEDHFLRRDKGVSPEIQRLCQSKCKRYACDIQKCLERNSYQEKSCWKEIAYWDICCDKIKAKNGKSVAVPHS